MDAGVESSVPVNVKLGEAQAVNAAPSSEHSKVAAASFEENPNVAVVLGTVPDGPLSMVVAGGLVSGAAKRITSSGRFCELSRLSNCCSAPPLLSPASLIRKPLFVLAYIAATCAETFHSRQPAVAPGPRPDMVVAASPAVAGWLSHTTPPSLQLPAARHASRMRSVASAFRCRRIVAD